MALRSSEPPSSVLVDSQLERGGMLSHEAVGETKRGTTNENQGAGAWYMAGLRVCV